MIAPPRSRSIAFHSSPAKRATCEPRFALTASGRHKSTALGPASLTIQLLVVRPRKRAYLLHRHQVSPSRFPVMDPMDELNNAPIFSIWG